MTDKDKQVIMPTERMPADVAYVTPTGTTPADLLRIAVTQKADIDKLQQLMELQERWEANEARKAFTVAMAGFRGDAPVLANQSEVDYAPKSGGRVQYKFTSLDYIMAQVNPVLAQHGLSVGWVTEQNGQVIVHCDITHIQGHSQRTTLMAPADTSGSKNAIQAIGSAVKYLQRYTLLSALGLATGGDDDDGRGPVAEVLYITEDQALTIDAYITDWDLNRDGFMKWLKTAGTESIAELRAADYDTAMAMLVKSKEKKHAE